MKFKLIQGVLLLMVITWAMLPSEPVADNTDIKLFCANGRVFIEFREKYNTWGTMWLNDDGLPVECGREKTNYRGTT